MTETLSIISPKKIMDAKEIWVSMVDAPYLKKHHPATFDLLCERARKDPDSFKLCVSMSETAHEFWFHVGEPAVAERLKRESMVDAWPYFIVLEPNSEKPSICTLGKGGFVRKDEDERDGYWYNQVLPLLKNVETERLHGPLYDNYSKLKYD